MSFLTTDINSDAGIFTLTVYGREQAGLSLSIDTNELHDYWDNDCFIRETLYPELENYLITLEPMKFEGAEILHKFDRTHLVELYGMLCKAEALGWMDKPDYAVIAKKKGKSR